ncbi:MAG: DUF1223 domain-containing protein [Pseudomonadota bacterium]
MSLSQLTFTRFMVRAVSAIVLLAALYGAWVMILTVQSDGAAGLFEPDATAQTTPMQVKSARTARLKNANGVGNRNRPILVEMFLSQSCSSCVPAAAFVRELAEREDVVILSWHVDYWDTLSVGRHGKWKDPYSSPDFTRRQRTYARQTFEPRRVYTPQAVVAGRAEYVGARRGQINLAITQYADDNALPIVTLQKSPGTDGSELLQVSVSNPPVGAKLRVVQFLPLTQTSILGGENAGVDWQEANVVVESTIVALSPGGPMTIDPAVYQSVPGTKCAILVENKNAQALAASYC